MAKKTHTVHRDLPVELSDEDKAKLGVDMASTETQIEQLKEDAKELNTKKRALQGHLNKVAHEIEDGAQERNVECHWVEDLPHGVKNLVRQDTMETVDTATLTHADLQEELPGTSDDDAGDVIPITKTPKQ